MKIKLKDFTSITTALSFIVSSVISTPLYAATEKETETARAATPGPSDLISPAFGRVTECSPGEPSKGLVIIIQDLHCHPQVQKNIDGILAALDRQYNLSTVYIEGAAGQVDTSWLKAFDPSPTKHPVADSLLSQGRLTGPEYFSLRTGRPHLLRGMEDDALWRENLPRLNDLLANRARYAEMARVLGSDLDAVRKEYLGARSIRYERLRASYRDGKIPAARYYQLTAGFLRAGTAQGGSPLDAFPQMRTYLELNDLARDLQRRPLQKELQSCLSSLQKKIPYRRYAALTKSLRENIDRESACILLGRCASEAGIDLPSTYPALAAYVAYFEKSRQLNPLALLREEERADDRVRALLARDQDELEVAFLAAFFPRVTDLLFNRLNSSDYAYLSSRLPEFRRLWHRYMPVDRLAALDGDIARLQRFYATNVKRNDGFMSALLADPARASGGTTVAVCGGFHTAGLRELCREQGIACVTITPTITEETASAEALYERLAREQKSFLASTFALRPLSQLDPALQWEACLDARVKAGKALSALARVGMTEQELAAVMNELCRVWNESDEAKGTGTLSYVYEGLTAGGDHQFSFVYTDSPKPLRFVCTPSGDIAAVEPLPAITQAAGYRSSLIIETDRSHQTNGFIGKLFNGSKEMVSEGIDGIESEDGTMTFQKNGARLLTKDGEPAVVTLTGNTMPTAKVIDLLAFRFDQLDQLYPGLGLAMQSMLAGKAVRLIDHQQLIRGFTNGESIYIDKSARNNRDFLFHLAAEFFFTSAEGREWMEKMGVPKEVTPHTLLNGAGSKVQKAYAQLSYTTGISADALIAALNATAERQLTRAEEAMIRWNFAKGYLRTPIEGLRARVIAEKDTPANLVSSLLPQFAQPQSTLAGAVNLSIKKARFAEEIRDSENRIAARTLVGLSKQVRDDLRAIDRAENPEELTQVLRERFHVRTAESILRLAKRSEKSKAFAYEREESIRTAINALLQDYALTANLFNDLDRKKEAAGIFLKLFNLLLLQDEADVASPFTPHNIKHTLNVRNEVKAIIAATESKTKSLSKAYGPFGEPLALLAAWAHDVGYTILPETSAAAADLAAKHGFDGYSTAKGYHAPLGVVMCEAPFPGGSVLEHLDSFFGLSKMKGNAAGSSSALEDLRIAIRDHGSDKYNIQDGLPGTGRNKLRVADNTTDVLTFLVRTADNLDIDSSRLYGFNLNPFFWFYLSQVKEASRIAGSREELKQTLREMQEKFILNYSKYIIPYALYLRNNTGKSDAEALRIATDHFEITRDRIRQYDDKEIPHFAGMVEAHQVEMDPQTRRLRIKVKLNYDNPLVPRDLLGFQVERTQAALETLRFEGNPIEIVSMDMEDRAQDSLRVRDCFNRLKSLIPDYDNISDNLERGMLQRIAHYVARHRIIELFDGVSPAKKGEVIIGENTSNPTDQAHRINSIYILLQGSLVFEQNGLELGRKDQPGIFGELSALTGEWPVNVRAGSDDTRYLRIDPVHFKGLMEDNLFLIKFADWVIASEERYPYIGKGKQNLAWRASVKSIIEMRRKSELQMESKRLFTRNFAALAQLSPYRPGKPRASRPDKRVTEAKHFLVNGFLDMKVFLQKNFSPAALRRDIREFSFARVTERIRHLLPLQGLRFGRFLSRKVATARRWALDTLFGNPLKRFNEQEMMADDRKAEGVIKPGCIIMRLEGIDPAQLTMETVMPFARKIRETGAGAIRIGYVRSKRAREIAGACRRANLQAYGTYTPRAQTSPDVELTTIDKYLKESGLEGLELDLRNSGWSSIDQRVNYLARRFPGVLFSVLLPENAYITAATMPGNVIISRTVTLTGQTVQLPADCEQNCVRIEAAGEQKLSELLPRLHSLPVRMVELPLTPASDDGYISNMLDSMLDSMESVRIVSDLLEDIPERRYKTALKRELPELRAMEDYKTIREFMIERGVDAILCSSERVIRPSIDQIPDVAMDDFMAALEKRCASADFPAWPTLRNLVARGGYTAADQKRQAALILAEIKGVMEKTLLRDQMRRMERQGLSQPWLEERFRKELLFADLHSSRSLREMKTIQDPQLQLQLARELIVLGRLGPAQDVIEEMLRSPINGTAALNRLINVYHEKGGMPLRAKVLDSSSFKVSKANEASLRMEEAILGSPSAAQAEVQLEKSLLQLRDDYSEREAATLSLWLLYLYAQPSLQATITDQKAPDQLAIKALLGSA